MFKKKTERKNIGICLSFFVSRIVTVPFKVIVIAGSICLRVCFNTWAQPGFWIVLFLCCLSLFNNGLLPALHTFHWTTKSISFEQCLASALSLCLEDGNRTFWLSERTILWRMSLCVAFSGGFSRNGKLSCVERCHDMWGNGCVKVTCTKYPISWWRLLFVYVLHFKVEEVQNSNALTSCINIHKIPTIFLQFWI